MVKRKNTKKKVRGEEEPKPFPMPLVKPEFPRGEEGAAQLRAWVDLRKPYSREFEGNNNLIYQRARVASNVRKCYSGATKKAGQEGEDARQKQRDKTQVSFYLFKFSYCSLYKSMYACGADYFALQQSHL